MTPAEIKLIAKILAFILAPSHPTIVHRPSELNPLRVPILIQETEEARIVRLSNEVDRVFEVFVKKEGK